MRSIPRLKVPNPSSTASSPCCSSYSSTSKPRSHPPFSVSIRIRNSQTDEGPLRRPVVRKPSLSPPPSLKPSPATASATTAVEGGAITLESQRHKAKELQEYFKQKKLEEANQGPFLGLLPKMRLLMEGGQCLVSRLGC